MIGPTIDSKGVPAGLLGLGLGILEHLGIPEKIQKGSAQALMYGTECLTVYFLEEGGLFLYRAGVGI